METADARRSRQTMRRGLALAIFCVLGGLPFRTADARWPHPAGGESSSGHPEVLFTFDDGPHETYTKAILDELARHHIRAIFFWVGRRLTRGSKIEKRRELVHRAVREGHLVANHTVTHADLCAVSPEQAAHEIDDNISIFERASGLPMILFRAPYGADCKRLRRMLAERNFDHLHWDIDPQEWSDHDSKRTAHYLIRRLRSLRGRAIIIMHDTHKVTTKALPLVLDWLEQENRRRSERGDKPTIRILSGSDLITERMQRALLKWAASSGVDSAEKLETAVSRLVP